MVNILKSQYSTINVGYYIPSADLLLRGAASGHLLKQQVQVIKYLLPRDVSGRGPTKSIPIRSHTVSFISIGCSWAEGFWNLFEVRWQTLQRLTISSQSSNNRAQ